VQQRDNGAAVSSSACTPDDAQLGRNTCCWKNRKERMLLKGEFLYGDEVAQGP
jgi:hypothetical protein